MKLVDQGTREYGRQRRLTENSYLSLDVHC